MKHVKQLIAQARAELPVRRPDDPLRTFASEVVLRDHARLLKLTLRKLHEGERIKRGDFRAMGSGELRPLGWIWCRRVAPGETVYRVI